MISRDVMKSFLRSAARAAAAQLPRVPLARAARERLRELSLGRAALGDDALTRAVTHVEGVAAATVRCTNTRLLVDIAFDDNSQLLMSIVPDKIAFAPGGAKELRFAIDPPELATDSRARDVIAAIASEIARALWRPALGGAPRSDHLALVSLDGDRLVADLRSVPAVRWALQQAMRAAIVEAIEPRAILLAPGHLDLPLAIHLR
jgi:hypothetical protein